MTNKLTPQALLSAYAQGYFPMAESRDATEVGWYYPEERGIIPLDDFHIPKSLAKFMRGMDYRISINRDFRPVITACADITESRESTWINDDIIDAYCELHALGYAHSIEVWEVRHSLPLVSRPKDKGIQHNKISDDILCSPASTDAGDMDPRAKNFTEFLHEDDKLIGGLYGIALGRAFFGESMFSKRPNASKVALVVLVDFLKENDFTLLDTQYVNEHLLQFGVKSIPRAEYLKMLQEALSSRA